MPLRLWERVRDWVILFSLLAGSTVMMLAWNEPLVRGLRAVSLETTSHLETRFAWVGHFLRALDENHALREENMALSSQLAVSRRARLENERLRRMLAFRDSTAFELVAARVIAKDITRQRNFLTLDVGRRDGVEEGMAVLDEDGIIGKVVLVSARFSRVMPYLNTDFHVPAKILPRQSVGVVSGTQTQRLTMDYVVKTEPVRPGQLVVTTSESYIFPADYPIGRVDSVAVRPGRNEWLLYLEPAASLERLAHAFVVVRHPDEERLAVEAATAR